MNTDYSYSRDDPSFVSDLVESQRYVELVARWLKGRGYDVTINPLRIRPDPSLMAEYADSGDLWIHAPDGDLRIEVKHRPSMNFTSLSTFAFGTVIVDVCHTWDRAKIKPYAYLILNSNASHLLIVSGDTHKSWVRRTRYDRGKGRKRRFYECPVELCKCMRVDNE